MKALDGSCPRSGRGPAASRFASVLVALAACGSQPSPEADAAERARWAARSQMLLQPLLNEGRVGCSELVIEISPNYFANVGRPAIDPKIQAESKTAADGIDEYVWTNLTGGLQGAIEITVGATDELTDKGLVRGKGTTFTVLHRARLRIHTKGVMQARLDINASGKPLVMSVGGKVRDLEAYELRNGALHAP